jgi:hypothetical protein
MGAGLRSLAGVTAASGHTLKRRPKLKRGARGVSHTEPASDGENPRSRERLKGGSRSPNEALPAAVPNL